MTNAHQLTEKIRADLKPLDQKIVQHRYLDVLENGSVAREKLKIFAGQQFHIILSDLRSIALLLAHHGHLPSRLYLVSLLHSENAAFEALANRKKAGRSPPFRTFTSDYGPGWRHRLRRQSSTRAV